MEEDETRDYQVSPLIRPLQRRGHPLQVRPKSLGGVGQEVPELHVPEGVCHLGEAPPKVVLHLGVESLTRREGGRPAADVLVEDCLHVALDFILKVTL